MFFSFKLYDQTCADIYNENKSTLFGRQNREAVHSEYSIYPRVLSRHDDKRRRIF